MKYQYLRQLFITSLISLCFTVLSFGQTPAPITFGQVDLKDLEMTSYSKDTAAVAVVLADYGDYFYNFQDNVPRVIYRRHVRIKILKKDGFKYANIKIPFYFPNDNTKAEAFNKIEATTWNLEKGDIGAV